ncbi:MAG TPA: type II toxin-antitoxin system prevent-host-death family antitoxin [Burkholderiales bacterium]|nr:type II toxin-antitoxin system prevent-host-death family antitoxin [Burkholderiales bacterium]
MKQFDATAAKNRFGRLLEAAAAGPVAVTRHGRVVAWVVAPKDYAEAPRPLEERLAARLRAAGVRYATLFGSLARGAAGRESDIDVAASAGKPMSSDLRAALIGIVADVAGRPVDLIDLETAQGTVLARAMGGTEILCDEIATRQRLITRLLRSEDDRRSAALAARAARAALFE